MTEKISTSETPCTGSEKKRGSDADNITTEQSPIETVSFFAGCGGMDLGFIGDFTYGGEFYEKLPFNIIKAYDNDEKCVETYKHNIGDHIENIDLSTHPPSEMPSGELLIGGFPCQEFSSCGPNRGLDSDRGKLYQVFVNYMAEREPLVVVAENVLHLQRMQEGAILNVIKRDLEAAGRGYRFEVWPLFAPDYGVPQTRARLFFVGVRNDLAGDPARPSCTHFMKYRSIDWAIADLEEVTDETVPNQSQYFRAAKAKNGRGQGDEVSRTGEPAYTVRSNAKSRIQFHYRLARRLTIRECARIQTFPDTFEFIQTTTSNMRQVGNAVPPILAHHLARSIAHYFSTLPKTVRFTTTEVMERKTKLRAPSASNARDAQGQLG